MKIAVLGGHGTAGKAAVSAAQAAGHYAAAISRRDGVDVLKGNGLEDAFSDVDTVIDAFNHFTMSARKAVESHERAARNVLSAAEHSNVKHVVLLSIIGVGRNPNNYYAGKLAQENVYEASSVPHTILRTAQFHEFAAQSLERTTVGPLALALKGRCQPLAVSEVGERLSAIAAEGPQGRAPDLAGPQEEELSEMARKYAKATGFKGLVLPAALPMAQLRGMRDGLNLPEDNAVLAEQTFDEWLTQF